MKSLTTLEDAKNATALHGHRVIFSDLTKINHGVPLWYGRCVDCLRAAEYSPTWREQIHGPATRERCSG